MGEFDPVNPNFQPEEELQQPIISIENMDDSAQDLFKEQAPERVNYHYT